VKAILIALVAWINANTALHYDPAKGMPQVIPLPVDAVVALSFRNPAMITPDRFSKARETLQAAYDDQRQLIYIRDDVDLNTVKGKAMLVHELVHHIQYRMGMNDQVPCQDALEKDAYLTQAKWLKEHGLEPSFSAFAVLVRSMYWREPAR